MPWHARGSETYHALKKNIKIKYNFFSSFSNAYLMKYFLVFSMPPRFEPWPSRPKASMLPTLPLCSLFRQLSRYLIENSIKAYSNYPILIFALCILRSNSKLKKSTIKPLHSTRFQESGIWSLANAFSLKTLSTSTG